MSTDRLTTWQLARMAECAEPDRPDEIGPDNQDDPSEDERGHEESPGAAWLRQVEDAYRDAVANDEFDPDDFTELADGLVPIYTHERWQVFVDIAAYNEDASELGGDAEDMTQAAGIALYMIAERLLGALCEADRDATDEDVQDDAEDTEAGR